MGSFRNYGGLSVVQSSEKRQVVISDYETHSGNIVYQMMPLLCKIVNNLDPVPSLTWITLIKIQKPCHIKSSCSTSNPILKVQFQIN